MARMRAGGAVNPLSFRVARNVQFAERDFLALLMSSGVSGNLERLALNMWRGDYDMVVPTVEAGPPTVAPSFVAVPEAPKRTRKRRHAAVAASATRSASGSTPAGPSHGKRTRMSLPDGLAPPVVAAILAERAHDAAVAKRTRSSLAAGSSASAVGSSSRCVVPSTADDAPGSSIVDDFLEYVDGGFDRDDWIVQFGVDGTGV